MKILVACEFSGEVRDAFIAKGHDAVSCDFLPTEKPGPHIQGDVRLQLGKEWDALIAFPSCTHLCVSGASTCLWLKGFPKLVPTAIVEGRTARVHREPPGPDRWKNRSRTYPGIAAAMAEQWGRL